jgi:hypothetical protein
VLWTKTGHRFSAHLVAASRRTGATRRVPAARSSRFWLHSRMEVVEFGRLTDAQRAELEGDERDPFDAEGATLRYRRKDHHVEAISRPRSSRSAVDERDHDRRDNREAVIASRWRSRHGDDQSRP